MNDEARACVSIKCKHRGEYNGGCRVRSDNFQNERDYEVSMDELIGESIGNCISMLPCVPIRVLCSAILRLENCNELDAGKSVSDNVRKIADAAKAIDAHHLAVAEARRIRLEQRHKTTD